jgi:hypothetical protein
VKPDNVATYLKKLIRLSDSAAAALIMLLSAPNDNCGIY